MPYSSCLAAWACRVEDVKLLPETHTRLCSFKVHLCKFPTRAEVHLRVKASGMVVHVGCHRWSL